MPGSLTHETRRSSKRRGGKFRRAENSSNHASMQPTHRFLFRSLLVSAKTSNFCDSQTFQIRYSLPSNGCCRNTTRTNCGTHLSAVAKSAFKKETTKKQSHQSSQLNGSKPRETPRLFSAEEPSSHNTGEYNNARFLQICASSISKTNISYSNS